MEYENNSNNTLKNIINFSFNSFIVIIAIIFLDCYGASWLEKKKINWDGLIN